MDWPDDDLFSFPDESDAFFSKVDDDLDHAIALSLQENCNAQIKEKSQASVSKEDVVDLDHAIALSLQENCAVELEKKSDAFLNDIDQDYDLAFALSLEGNSETLNEKSVLTSLPKSTSALSIVDKQWEVIDPTPDIRALFLQFNVQFFYGKLEGVEVKWSPRMTLCAGVCSYEGRGGLCSVRLSLPLLKLRPRRDLVETLLHEMIHAYLFVTANNKDHDAHGPEFLKHMHRINKETGTKISVYHNFHDEVDSYRKHIWKCNGPCQKKSPYFGYVRRAMNRAPGPKDFWWAQHQSSCGGTFTKFSEPEGYKKKSSKINKNETIKRKPLNDTDNQLPNIKKFLTNSPSGLVSNNALNTAKNHVQSVQGKKETYSTGDAKSVKTLHDSSVSTFPSNKAENIASFTGDGFLLGSSSSATPRSFLASVRKELASSSTASKNCFSNPDLKNSTQTLSNNRKNMPKESCVLGSQDSSQNNVGHKVKPVNKHGSQKPGHVQSSMDKFLTSPSRLAVKIDMNNTTKDSSSNTSPKVKCPVCFKLFSSLEINAHLDSCLAI